MQYIKDKRTNAIFQIYGVVSNGNKNYFIIWDETLERFSRRQIEDFYPLSSTEEKKMSLQNIRNNDVVPYITQTMSNMNNSQNTLNNDGTPKCRNERQRKSTYVSCARCDFPVPIDSCNRYCEKYSPIQK